MKRRHILMSFGAAAAAGALVAPFAAAPAKASDDSVGADERILGNPEAPVTIIEYASLTCPHCASFHKEVLPTIKKNWIDTGKARLVYRDFPLDGLALRAAMLASCIEGDGYFSFLEVLFSSQQKWARAADPAGELAKIARLAGIDRATFDRCFADQAEMDRILQQRVHAAETHEVQSTPSFIVNGRKIEGGLGVAQFEEVLKRAESKS